HIDLSNAAFVARSKLLGTGDGAGNDVSKPTPAARHRCDERSAGLGAYRSTVMWSRGTRHDNIASPFHWRLLPGMRPTRRSLSTADRQMRLPSARLPIDLLGSRRERRACGCGLRDHSLQNP